MNGKSIVHTLYSIDKLTWEVAYPVLPLIWSYIFFVLFFILFYPSEETKMIEMGRGEGEVAYPVLPPIYRFLMEERIIRVQRFSINEK